METDILELVLSIFKLLLIILFISHWGACFFYYIGQGEQEALGKSWILQAGLINETLYDKYISSLYYFITTMSTVGYGDIVPVTFNERIYTMVIMLLACGVFAYVIGSLGTVVNPKSDGESNFRQKIIHINQYLTNKGVSNKLKLKVRKYLEHLLVRFSNKSL